ncbi:S-layer protein [Lysinibacillus sp. KCTC 33748]|uniref:NEAT domain-containing protein n=1 Tax=unclassified Lysinibacillus TaxID=2636778 RepID=UPI0009A86526|nr:MULTISPECIES: NEAT domain-containing protein [unclassified Lysinibacillus]OXS77140.1 S-layer protein [Lysinibacillus sp. KCTC 33748]SKB30706.1 Heme-binding NEAT domain-containing protein [Lysinibacillus sp. AC-3]
MAKKRQSRATKIVLASLLAASLSVPSFASAKVADVTTTNTEVKAEATKSENTGTIVDFQTFKPGTTEPQPAISSHLVTQGTIVEKDGKFEAKLTVAAKSAPMIAGLQTKQGDKFVDATEVKNADGTITYSFPVVAGEVLSAKIHVVVASANMDKWYDFDLKAVESGKSEEVKEEVKVNEVAVTVYKNGTSEESIMKQYIKSKVDVSVVNGKNIVTMTFPQGQYVKGFKVEGKEATLVSKDDATNTSKYSFEVADLKKLVNAQLHIVVNEPDKGVNYDSNHQVQFSFAVENAVKPVVNPFKDISNDANKDAILALYSKGIVKGQDYFKPNDNITRSQFALMIARSLNVTSTKDAGFKDTAKLDAERVQAINALTEAGIVMKAEKFNPNDTLTRQQAAVMIYRTVTHVAGKEMNYGDPSLSYYADGATVKSEEARKAFAFLYAGKIMTGSVDAKGKTVINASSPLKRAHMAKILNGSLQYMNK